MEKNNQIRETEQYRVLSSDKQDGLIVLMKDGSGIAFVDGKGNIQKGRYASASIVKRHARNFFEKIRFGFRENIVLYSVRRVDGKGLARVTRSGKVVEERGDYCNWNPDNIGRLNIRDYKETYMLRTLENEINFQLRKDALAHKKDEEQDELARRIKLTLRAFKEFKEKVESANKKLDVVNSGVNNIKEAVKETKVVEKEKPAEENENELGNE